ncbi:MAG: hypothetical protein WA445_24745 [Pseudolabrys sp.]|jgi:hypothetical protein
MSRRDKAVKTRRHKTLTRRNVPKATRHRSSLAAGKGNVEWLTRERDDALRQPLFNCLTI